MLRVYSFFFIVVMLQFQACKKNDVPADAVYSDDGLVGFWKLDSTTTIGGFPLQNDDDGTSMEGTVMYIHFDENGKVFFDYADISGGGTYEFNEYHQLTITSFSDPNIGYPKSRYISSFVTYMNMLNRYSGSSGKLLLYFNKSSRVMHCSAQ
mgnify:CR=1 FL=1|tara:strand:- start:181658 stop:182113 length:456 start_codon:yes stop_codon:yes gene_type:complete